MSMFWSFFTNHWYMLTCGGPSFGGHLHAVICSDTTWSCMMMFRHNDGIHVPLNRWLMQVAVVAVGNCCSLIFLSASSLTSPHLTSISSICWLSLRWLTNNNKKNSYIRKRAKVKSSWKHYIAMVIIACWVSFVEKS